MKNKNIEEMTIMKIEERIEDRMDYLCSQLEILEDPDKCKLLWEAVSALVREAYEMGYADGKSDDCKSMIDRNKDVFDRLKDK